MSFLQLHRSKPNSPERRRAPRLALEQPVKLQAVDTGKLFSGRAENVSSTGMLLTVHNPSLLVPGQRVRVAVQWSGRQVVVRKDDMARATVLRSLGHGGSQRLAVQFETPLQMQVAQAG